MSEPKKCARCGEITPTIDNVADTTSYYGFQVKTETTVRRTVRLIIWVIYGRYSKRGESVIQADEEQPLCFDCGGLLVGRFMQGRSIHAIEGKEGR